MTLCPLSLTTRGPSGDRRRSAGDPPAGGIARRVRSDRNRGSARRAARSGQHVARAGAARRIRRHARGSRPEPARRGAPRGARRHPGPARRCGASAREDRLRVAAVEGVAAVDPAQADVPQEWRDASGLSNEPRLGSAGRRAQSRPVGCRMATSCSCSALRGSISAGSGYTDRRYRGRRDAPGLAARLREPYTLRSARTASGEPLLITAGMAHGTDRRRAARGNRRPHRGLARRARRRRSCLRPAGARASPASPADS